ncbi:amino acid ABC transporter substrate-binding protein [Ideonella sp. DXS29W]|uniref:Amino acid ABC transporter substrate-binding protein n=1 Tax=Ideonella lacteola TaxID=2984193 RepID=A0ABU9BYI6_9BURK
MTLLARSTLSAALATTAALCGGLGPALCHAAASTTSAPTSAWSPSAALAESAVLRKIRDTGVIVIGHRLTSSPFSYLDAKLRPVGYSVDLCQRVVEAVRQKLDLRDLEVKMVAVSSATRMPLVANGTVDLECGVTTNTVERQKTQSFSITTYVAASRLLAKRESEIHKLDDLRGKVVASTIATTSIRYLNSVNEALKLDMKIVAGQDDTDAFQMVQNDRAVAFAMDDVLLRSLMASASNPTDYTISDDMLSIEPYGIGLPKDDPVFKQLVDSTLTAIYRSGEIYSIYSKWFMAPIPPRGIKLRMPMSEPLLRAIRQPTDSPDPQDYR